MRVQDVVAVTEHFTLANVRCSAPVSERWSEPEPMSRHALVFLQQGLYTRRVGGVDQVVDTTTAYFERPGMEQQVSHPRGGDICTTIALSDDLLASIAGGDPDPGPDLAMIDPRVAVGLGLLMRSARGGDVGGDVTERLVTLLALLITQRAPGRVAAGRPSTIRDRRRIVDETRLLLNSSPTLSLIDLAAAVGYSPHHLSRVFKDLIGTSVSRYRNLLRVREAVARLDDGHDDLSGLAAELGFADHAHLTRTVGALTGFAPSVLRRALREEPSPTVRQVPSPSQQRDAR